jgi:hypothetical protein
MLMAMDSQPIRQRRAARVILLDGLDFPPDLAELVRRAAGARAGGP